MRLELVNMTSALFSISIAVLCLLSLSQIALCDKNILYKENHFWRNVLNSDGTLNSEQSLSTDNIKNFTSVIKIFQGGLFEHFLNTDLKKQSEKLRAIPVSPECLTEVEQLMLDAKLMKPYAIKILDASTKLPSGIFDGKMYWMGSYDECVAAISPTFKDGHSISGKYFYSVLNVQIKQVPSLTVGYCLPKTCNNSDAQNILNYEFSSHNISVVSAIHTKGSDVRPWTTGAIISLVVCGVLGTLVLAGTLIESVFLHFENLEKEKNTKMQNHGNINISEPSESTELLPHISNDNDEPNPKKKKTLPKCQFLTSFSLINNTRKLLNTSTAKGPLSCLNGFRVLSIWWVILGHTFQFMFSTPPIDNPLSAASIVKRFTFLAIVNGTFSVDSFFFMSGLLVTFLCLKNLSQKNGKLNWLIFYFHRFWRLTPAYGFCIMIFGALAFNMTVGPAGLIFEGSDYVEHVQGECSRTWWANLLYINNFYPNLGDVTHICMPWSWYLANDMQFYLISPFIIVLMYKRRTFAVGVCCFLIVACIFIRIMTAFEYGILIPNNKITKHAHDSYAIHGPLYNKPYTRIAPYIVGMLVGMILHSNSCRARLSKLFVLIGWCVAIATGMSVVYGYYYYTHNSVNASLGISVFYIGFSRFAWSLALAWLVYACATGYGGPVNVILSWKTWAPLGRLTYCAYLIHPIIVTMYICNQRGSFHYTEVNIAYVYVGNVVFTYIASYLISMTVEAPMMALEKLFIKQ